MIEKLDLENSEETKKTLTYKDLNKGDVFLLGDRSQDTIDSFCLGEFRLRTNTGSLYLDGYPCEMEILPQSTVTKIHVRATFKRSENNV